MKNMLRRPIAMLLAMIMILSCVPMEGLAAIVPVNGPTTSSEGISLYSIVRPSVATYTYNFYLDAAGTNKFSSQIVKNEEALLDPGTPKDTDVHKEFVGWYTAAEGGEKFTSFGEIIVGTESQTINLYARFKTVYFVFFEDNTGRIIHTEKGEPGDTIQTSVGSAGYPLGGEESLVGWCVKGTDTPATSVTLDNADIHLTAKVLTGHWITFDSQGGTYVEPLFVEGGQRSSAPTAPTRPGYTFSHWSETENGTAYAWNTTVDKNLTIYAVWTPNTNTQYTVIHWIENANDDGYSFGASTTGTGTTGATTNAQELTGTQWTNAGIDKKDGRTDFAGFKPQAITQQTIAGDGSTVVNVYYKRQECNIKFCTTRTWSGWQLQWQEDEDLRITAKYGADISDNWPTYDGSSTWSTTGEYESGELQGPYQVNIDTMPLGGDEFYGPKTGRGTQYAYYYVEILPGETGGILKGETTYKLDHTDSSPGSGYKITDDDKYPITGFKYKEFEADQNEDQDEYYYYNGAKFYYTRNDYSIIYVSGGSTVNTVSYKFEQSIADAGNYKPTTKPVGLDAYEFKGWYADPACTKEYVFAADAKMPAESITVYAKWAAPVLKGTIYLTIEGTDTPFTVEVPYGGTLEDTLAKKQAEIMEKQGNNYEWHCWKKEDGTTFEPSTQIYANITLKPYYTSTAAFTVTYETGVDGVTAADSKKYAEDSYADIAAPSARTSGGKTFLGWTVKGDSSGKLYQPRDKYLIKGSVTFVASWGDTPATVSLTYHANYSTDHRFAGTKPTKTSDTVSDIPNNGTVNAAANMFEAPVGYKFGGWATTNSAATAEIQANDPIQIDNNGENHLYAVWMKDTTQTHTVGYTVKYFKANDAGSYDEMTSSAETKTQSGWIGEQVTITVSVSTTKDLPDGYAFEKTEPATLPVNYTVAAYGQSSTESVIKVYYKKNQFTVSYEYTGTVPTGAAPTPAPHTETYNTTVTVAAAPTLAGYTFSGWSTGDAIIADGKFTMPAKNVEIKGSWTANGNTPYTIEYYLQDLNVETQYSKNADATEKRTGTTDQTASVQDADKKSFTGFTFDEHNTNNVLEGTITGDGLLVLKLYYKRNTYTVTYTKGDHGDFTDDVHSNVKYGANTPAFAGTKGTDGNPKGAAGYTFTGWDKAIAQTVTADATYTAQWTANTGTGYKVEHYQQNLDGNGYTLKDTENLTGTTDTKATAVAKTYEGFTFDEHNTNNVPEGTITGDGKLVLKLYYTRNSYNVTYAYTGTVPTNAPTVPPQTSHKYQEVVTVAAAPTLAGYTFSGWSTTDASIRDDGTFFMRNNAVTLTGSWQIDEKQTATVTYKAEGHGTVSKASETIQIVTANGLTGSTATANNGYKFVGWYKGETKISDAAVLDKATAQANLNKDTNNNYADTEFVAKFERDFDSNDNDGQFKFVVTSYTGTYDAAKHSVGISGLIAGEDSVSFSTDGGTTWTTAAAWNGTIPADLMQSEVKWNTTPSLGYYPAGGTEVVVAYPTVSVKATNGKVEKTLTGTITINPVSLSIGFKGAKFSYDGNPHGLLDAYTLENCWEFKEGTAPVTGQTLSISGTPVMYTPGVGVTAQEKVTKVGTYTGIVTATFSITDGSKSTLFNYLISTAAEQLVIEGDSIVPEKTLVTAGTVELGSLLTYNITVENVSTTEVTDVQVEDTTAEIIVPQGVTGVTLSTDKHMATIASIPAAGKVVLNAQHAVTEQDLIEYAGKDANGDDKLYKNTASIKLGDKTISVSDNGIDLPDPESKLTVTKTTTSKPADEELGKYKLGETIEYDITVTNDGNQTIDLESITDTLAGANILEGSDFTSENGKATFNPARALKPGESLTVQAQYIVTEADILAGKVVNGATAAGKDPSGNDPEVTPGETEDKTETPNASFTLEKTLTNTPAKSYFTAGETAEFSVVVENNGNVTLTNVTVKEELTGATFTEILENKNNLKVNLGDTVATIESIAPGQTVTLKAKYTVTVEDLGTELENIVTGKGNGPKPDPENPPIDPEDPEGSAKVPVDEAVIVMITKKWDDQENKFESRPESVSFSLKKTVGMDSSNICKLEATEENGWTAQSDKLPAHTADGQEITYTLEEETVKGYTGKYTMKPVENPASQGNQNDATQAKTTELQYTFTNTLNKYKLTIRYWKHVVGGEKAFNDYTAEYEYNAPYSVQSPGLYGWEADMERVEDKMPAEDLVVDVVYRQLVFKLTIYYIFEDGTTAHKEYEAKLTASEKFAVESPEIQGYKPNLWMISGEMPDRDLNYTVIYMAQNTPVDLSAATAPLGIGNVVPNAGDCFD